VTCIHDNARVVDSASVIFLTCLPSQLPLIASELRPRLAAFQSPLVPNIDQIPRNRSPLIYSIISATSTSRMQKLLGTVRVIRPNVKAVFSSVDEQKIWNTSLDVIQSFGMPEMVNQTCPLRVIQSSGTGISYVFIHFSKLFRLDY